jgi:hypothetical protein
VPAEPRRQRVLAVGQGQWRQARRLRLDLAAQRIERDELLGRDLALGKPAEAGEQRLACGLEVVGRPGGCGGRVVDLVREAGGERAKGDEGLALPCRRLDGARGTVQPPDEVPAEREPGGDQLAEHLGGHPEYPRVRPCPAGREVDTVLVPGAESAGPAARHVHVPDHGVLAADVAHEVDGAVEQHPPEVSVLALAEHIRPRLDANLGAPPGQLRELVIGQAFENAERAELVDVRRLPQKSPPWPGCPDGQQDRRTAGRKA